MKVQDFLLLIILGQTNGIGKYCEAPEDDTVTHCYIKENLISLTHSPNQFTVDRHTNYLYFSFDKGTGEYLAAVFKIDNKELRVLKGIKDAFAITYDHKNQLIYFGGTHGLYKYNASDKTLKRFNMSQLDIWWLFVKQNIIYFIKFPNLTTYSYINSSIAVVNELNNNVVHQMVLDNENEIFYINNTGLFTVRPKEETHLLMKENARFVNMAVDNMGRVFACAEDGIYVITKLLFKAKKVISIRGVLGIAFDKANNIIYSDSHELVRLIRI